ncbi:MAG: efflux RND transporter periplasmic adaptor subunit [Spirochaetaceae bacterium]|nr:efflux RND transporter periplasmic adaptor subunit [Spirochaetaceae bacterium]
MHDPARGSFYQIDRFAFAILYRWKLGDAEKIAAAVREETLFDASSEDVEDIRRFAEERELLRRSAVPGSQWAGGIGYGTGGRGPCCIYFAQLLQQALFVRGPKIRPQKFLATTYPLVRRLYSRTAAAIIITMGLIGIYLVGRQWDRFLRSFDYFFCLQGIVFFAAAVVVGKSVHEFAHGYTAYRHGCRVTSMGLAFLMGAPVLYTDTTEAWFLPSRKHRLAIGAAGMIAELSLAAVAAFFWGFLPDGPIRSAAFYLGSTAVVSSLAVNLMPYMRFDGYYLLSDLLGIPNLFQRSFALGRWWLRERLFGLGIPPPEAGGRYIRAFMVGFAFWVWTHRLLLFIGISLIVYHLVFKAMGIILFAMYLAILVLRPLRREFSRWWDMRGQIRFGRHTASSLLFLSVLLLLLFVPWRGAVYAPAMLMRQDRMVIYAPADGWVQRLDVEAGQRVEEGERLMHLRSPSLEHEMEKTRLQVAMLEGEISFTGADPQKRMERLTAVSRLELQRRRLEGLEEMNARLELIAPFDGEVTVVMQDLQKGDPVGEETALIEMITTGGNRIEAYVFEEDLPQVSTADYAVFYPEGAGSLRLPGRITEVEQMGTEELTGSMLAAAYGGQIPVRRSPKGRLLPEKAVYRLFFRPDVERPVSISLSKSRQRSQPGSWFPRKLRGTLRIEGQRRSIAGRLWNSVVGTIIRETGF